MCAYLVSRNSQPVVKKSPANVKSMGVQGYLQEYLQPARRSRYRLAAGSTLKGWHLQVRKFWEKRPLVVAVSHLHLHIPLNNSNILEKTLIILKSRWTRLRRQRLVRKLLVAALATRRRRLMQLHITYKSQYNSWVLRGIYIKLLK